MWAIMGQIQAEQEKTHIASQAGDGGSIDVQPDTPIDPVRSLRGSACLREVRVPY